MKELLQQYAAYNTWAYQKLFDGIKQLSEEQLHSETQSSFPTIYKTFLHLWDGESIWWQRLKLAEQINLPSENFAGSFEELQQKLLVSAKQWEEWVSNAGEHQLQHVFAYRNSKTEQLKQPVYQALLHLFNHNTMHRGQVITMMRMFGIKKIPRTDFLVFVRGKNKG
ncbi:MAG: DinB family protein [Ferruginibacter sp.]